MKYYFIVLLLLNNWSTSLVHTFKKSKLSDKNVLSSDRAVSSTVKGKVGSLPPWFYLTVKQRKLDDKYELHTYLKPAYLKADFNGDGIEDLVATIKEKKSHKTGLLLIHGGINTYMVFGAGSKLGKPNFDESDDLKWVDGWEVFKDKVAYETKFDNGDMVGTIKRKLSCKAISIWSVEDGQPLAGGLIAWNGDKYVWIHQGE